MDEVTAKRIRATLEWWKAASIIGNDADRDALNDIDVLVSGKEPSFPVYDSNNEYVESI